LALNEEFITIGNRLFKQRSYLPLLFLVVLIPGFMSAYTSENSFFYSDLWKMFCMFVSTFGVFLRVITVGFVPPKTSGRNTKSQVANSLNTTVIYSIVRHPLYLANFFMWLGFMMFVPVWWLSVVFIFSFWLYYERIMFAEEEFLKNKFDDYDKWANVTPAFIPNLKIYRRSELSFSIKSVLNREYTSIFELTTGFALLKTIENYLLNRELLLSNYWIFVLLLGSIQYFIIRSVKKYTNILKSR